MLRLDDVLERVREPKKEAGEWLAFCPCHRDGEKHGRRSLAIREKPGGGVLFHCFSGCEYSAIVAALGLGGNGSKPEKPKKEIVATYPYHDADGTLLAEIVRYTPKSFAIRRPDGHGGWTWNRDGLPALLYRLPEMLEAACDARTVLVVEGERAADAAANVGLVAVSNAFGAGKWTEAHAALFPSGTVVGILPDNDEPGRAHAQTVARTLTAHGCDARIVTLPGLPEKGDICEYLAAGGTRDDVLVMVDRAPTWRPPAEAATKIEEKPEADEDLAYTDMGNAARFARDHGDRIAHCAALGGWLVWDGRRWRRDALGHAHECAKKTARTMLKEAVAIEDDKERRAAVSAAMSCQNAAKLRAMLQLAETDPRIAAEESAFDTRLDLLNVENGMIHLQTGELLPHDPAVRCTQLAPVRYDPSAKAPVFAAFIDRIFQHNADLIAYVQKALGYSILGTPRLRALFICYGSGANGKSTLMNAMADTLGDYANDTPTEALLRKRNGTEATNDIARLRGARFVAADESDPGRKLDVGKIKRLTGGESVPVRFLYQEFFSFTPRFTLWLSTNYRPEVPPEDDAIWDRLKLIPFLERIPEEEWDLDLRDKLRAEAPAILAWLVRGALAFRAEGLAATATVARATGQYRKDNDQIGAFLEERTVKLDGARIGKGELYNAYLEWAEAAGEEPETQKAFGLRVARDFTADRCRDDKKKLKRVWLGITWCVTRDACDATADDFSR